MGNGQIPPKTRSDGKTKNVPWALLPFNWKSKPWTFSCPQLCIDRRMGRMGKRNGRTFLMFPDTESWNLTCVTGLILCSYMDLFNERMTLHEAGSRPEECQCPFHNLEAEFGIQDDWALNNIESIQNTSQDISRLIKLSWWLVHLCQDLGITSGSLSMDPQCPCKTWTLSLHAFGFRLCLDRPLYPRMKSRRLCG